MEMSDFGRAVDHPTAGRRNRKAAGCVVTLPGATSQRPRLGAYRWVTTQLGKLWVFLECVVKCFLVCSFDSK